MKRYTIRCQRTAGSDYALMGTFSGTDEGAALNAAAVEQGHDDFAKMCANWNLTRDNFKVEFVS